jgi:ABC-type transport system involved in cytochrome bd biosynthesis fused ATPase/permease subunit
MKNINDYINGFKCGHSIGFVLGRYHGIIEIHLIKSMLFIFISGFVVGYIVSKILM